MHHEAQKLRTTAFPRQRGERELALAVEPLERELGSLRTLAAGGRGRDRPALVVEELPEQQCEEQHDEPDGRTLRDQQQAAAHVSGRG